MRSSGLTYAQWVKRIENFKERYAQNVTRDQLFGFPLQPAMDAEAKLLNTNVLSIAYLSMEYGLTPSFYNVFTSKPSVKSQNSIPNGIIFDSVGHGAGHKVRSSRLLDMPIYSGGLGVLAGDTVKSVADAGLSFVAVGVLWNKGYFKQVLDVKHGQKAEELFWSPTEYPGLIPLKDRVTIETVEGPLTLRLWKYYVYSFNKQSACPLVLLDANIPENRPAFRTLTDQLYRSDHVRWNIFQRIILGIGGIKALEKLGYAIERYHLNEGHAAFACVEKTLNLKSKRDLPALQKKFVYTCHTPVAAGHDRFACKEIEKVLKKDYIKLAMRYGADPQYKDVLNLTFLALNYSTRVNAVSQKHGDVMRAQFPDFQSKINAVTNGIHLPTWISASMQALLDEYKEAFGDWRNQTANLRQADALRRQDGFRKALVQAHQVNKRKLIAALDNDAFKENVLTICWARRMTGYKRPSMVLQDLNALKKIAQDVGPVQIIFAGKAHPQDAGGAKFVHEVLSCLASLKNESKLLRLAFVENYDTYWGKLLSNSVDIWLNNPLPPFEASGTSGMKAILNGVLQMTTYDGWVVEAKEDIGWTFGYRHKGKELGKESHIRIKEDAKALYSTLKEAASLYYLTFQKGRVDLKSPWVDKMINCLVCSAAFNTGRMVEEYRKKMWMDSVPSAKSSVVSDVKTKVNHIFS